MLLIDDTSVDPVIPALHSRSFRSPVLPWRPATVRRDQAALVQAGRLRQAYFSERISGRDLARLLARVWQAPLAGPAAHFAPDTPASALSTGFAPLTDGRWLISADTPYLPRLLAMAAGRLTGRIVIAEPLDYRTRLRNHLALKLADDASFALARHHPGMSAREPIRSWQGVALASFIMLLAVSLWSGEGGIAAAGLFVLGLFFFATIVVHATALVQPIAAPTPMSRRDSALPGYGVLVPLHREAAIVPELISALRRLDYPRDRLDIRLIVEHDDAETIEALARADLPRWMQVIVAPDGRPRTKPRALNIALAGMNSEFVVVYDAEDNPAPDQLRLAVETFRRAEPEVVCLQARLAIENADEGWLSALFAVEYAGLFDVIKPGLAALGLPVPLGGTSNHFRRKALEDIGGWDAWNVTEDIDLGMRIARAGYLVGDLPSTTYETAPTKLASWLAQRQRWLKGWMQTALTHTREPLRLWRELGPARTLGFAAVVGGVVLGALSFPILSGLFAARLMEPALLGSGGPLGWFTDALGVTNFFAGLVAMVLPSTIGLFRRRLRWLLPFVLLLPVHALLISLAAWLALLELIRAPYRWNKTDHVPRRRRSEAVPDHREEIFAEQFLAIPQPKPGSREQEQAGETDRHPAQMALAMADARFAGSLVAHGS